MDRDLIQDTDTIVAQATPAGMGGVGIVRVSGPLCRVIADGMVRLHRRSHTSSPSSDLSLKHSLDASLKDSSLKPRYAHSAVFFDQSIVIDEGLALFFPAPHSFTGEDVLELQAHGSPIVMSCLIDRAVALGARLARPGEFSERAFLNNKLDLIQAEAIADLIHSTSVAAARSAQASLQGRFSERVNQLVEALIALRVFVEAAIDFPDEDIDFLSDKRIQQQLSAIDISLDETLQQAKQGVLLQDGMTVVIAGQPNAGKSCLLNQLAGCERAIVTDVPGTTRDVLREWIHIDGLPIRIIDTAGLRVSTDPIEQEGIRRALLEIKEADLLLFVIDSSAFGLADPEIHWTQLDLPLLEKSLPTACTVIYNKIDCCDLLAAITEQDNRTLIQLSAKTGAGLDLLTHHLKTRAGFSATAGTSVFSARKRHVLALEAAKKQLVHAAHSLQNGAGELLAEDLRAVQQALEEITGAFTPDDLLGKIFSTFCIGK